MNEIVQEFYSFFGIDALMSAESMTALDLIRGSVACAVAVVFMLAMFRVVTEFIKTVTDWGRFR